MTHHADADFDGDLDQGNLFYYDENWRILEERIDDGFASGDASDWLANFVAQRITQRVWGLEYIDELLYFQTDVHSTTGGVADGRFYGGQEGWYALTDRMYSVIGVADLAGDIVERVRYSPYGEARHEWGSDLNGDGAVNSTDLFSVFLASFGSSYGDTSSPVYNPDCDLDQDGDVDSSDQALFLSQYTAAALAAGNVSSPSVRNLVGYDGYLYDEAVGMHHVRHRWYDPILGAWTIRDPDTREATYRRYLYCNSSPVEAIDPEGLFWIPVVVAACGAAGSLTLWWEKQRLLDDAQKLAQQHLDALLEEWYKNCDPYPYGADPYCINLEQRVLWAAAAVGDTAVQQINSYLKDIPGTTTFPLLSPMPGVP
ncbi:MAG: hypothetical protein IBJ10_08265 [Phycisphaerales bacterium]|nr:hypothetical protein [Phycisphaerales bacterium]